MTDVFAKRRSRQAQPDLPLTTLAIAVFPGGSNHGRLAVVECPLPRPVGGCVMCRGLISLLILAAAFLPGFALDEGAAGETAQQAPQNAADIQRKLLARVEFEYEAVPLLEFVKRVSAKSGLPMRVDEQ